MEEGADIEQRNVVWPKTRSNANRICVCLAYHPVVSMRRLYSPVLTLPLCHAPWSRRTSLVIFMQLLM